ncbi:hypothetical protein chiPu_0025033, partial [Chiloscyllium punctatum]|nr:hypothetical protein [Chiloscyllium punctatum]
MTSSVYKKGTPSPLFFILCLTVSSGMADEKKAQQTSKKGAKKIIKKAPAKGGKRRKRTRKESYAIYIYKVMKQVHPDT